MLHISEDDEEIHPPLICNKHRCVLSRARVVHSKGEVFQPVDASTHHFKPHDSKCDICVSPVKRAAKRGRTSKNKAAGPGKYVRATDSFDQILLFLAIFM